MRSVIRQNAQLIHRARAHGSINHPRARKIRQIQKVVKRNLRKAHTVKGVQSRRIGCDEKLFWLAAAAQRLVSNRSSNFASFLNADGGFLPIVIEALVHLYIHRADAELAELKAQRQPPRGRIRQLEGEQQLAETAFSSRRGFPVPPLASKADVELTIAWLDAVIALDEHKEGRIIDSIPRMPEAFAHRATFTMSKRGVVLPTDNFLQLVSTLRDHEGIGDHIASAADDEPQEQGDDAAAGGGAASSGGGGAQHRRRFGRVKTMSSAAMGAKAVVPRQIAVAGMAKRAQEADADRTKRRRRTLQEARGQTQVNNIVDEFGDVLL